MNYSDQKQDKLISAMKLQVTSTGIGALIASIWTASLPISVCVCCVLELGNNDGDLKLL